jgi:hypothetical protein
MTSKVGKHWDGHPLLLYAANNPTSVDLHLRFVIWDPSTADFVAVDDATVTVIEGSTTPLKAIQGSSTTATVLQGQTDSNGNISFVGGILPQVPIAGLDLHFQLSGLSTIDWYYDGATMKKIAFDTWSTAGWSSLDGLSNGTISGFTGNHFGEAGAPVTLVVGVPCWIKFSYQRKYGDSPANFPAGTRIKLITLDTHNSQVDLLDDRTTKTSEFKTVLGNVTAGSKILGLIFMRFSKAADDAASLVLDPFAIRTDNDDFMYDDDSNPTDLAAGPAFHFQKYHKNLKKADAWVKAVDTFSLSKPNPPNSVSALDMAVSMPEDFQLDKPFSDIKKTPEVLEKMTLCTALYGATLIREFSGLVSSLLSPSLLFPRTEWQGLNSVTADYETRLVLANSGDVETQGGGLVGLPLSGEVRLPLSNLYDANLFYFPNNEPERNQYRYLTIRNIIFHEVGHCLMFRYSFDEPIDGTIKSKHLFNHFVNYDDPKRHVVPFWEGWAVYFSMLSLGPKDFLASQLTRIAAKDSGIRGNLSTLLAAINSTSADLDGAIANTFSSGILDRFVVEGPTGDVLNLPIAGVVTQMANSSTRPDFGLASEMCLAFSLYTLTRTIAGGTLSGPGPSNGDGMIPLGTSYWYGDTAIRDRLWTAIYRPFFGLKGGNVEDTTEKFVTAIGNAMRSDPQWSSIKPIFNTYYLLIDSPVITSPPPMLLAGSGAQTITISGSDFVPLSSSPGDGGLTVAITCPSSVINPSVVTNSLVVTVTSSTSLTIKALFPATGTYTLNFFHRWAPVMHPVTVT